MAPAIEVTKTADPTAVPETGGDVTFTFVVKNTSTEEPVTITSLSDSVYGTLDGDDDCKVGTVLAAGASAEFSITKWVEGDYSGPDHVDVFTAKAVDNDDTEATDDDDATVDFTDVLPTIEVTKTPNRRPQCPETGEWVTYKVDDQEPHAETVTLDAITDQIGDGDATDITGGLGAWRPPPPTRLLRAATTDTYVGYLQAARPAARRPAPETDTVTADGVRQRRQLDRRQDDATVDLVDVSLDIEKATNGQNDAAEDNGTAGQPEILTRHHR